MEIRQSQKLSQKLALTPQMKQSIHVLQLSLLDLKDYLESHAEENPALDREKGAKGLEESLSQESIRTLLNLSDHGSGNIASYNIEDIDAAQKKQRYRQSLVTKGPNLQEHLLRQLRLHRLSKPKFTLGEHIVSDIDENGYLKSSLGEIHSLINKGKLAQAEPVTKKEIEEALKLIQTFDPTGVGARNLKECLLIQLKSKKINDPLILKIVENYLVDIAKCSIAAIAKKLKKPATAIEKALKAIASLEPKPGRIFIQEEYLQRKSFAPDVIVEKVAGRYEIIVNARGLPHLIINKRYRQLLQSDTTSQDTRKYLNQKIKSALWLIKAVSQREETIRKITQCILKIQKDFLENGDLAALNPLTLKEVARKIKRNESTVSRVVNSKYIQTPAGTFRMNCFFSTHLETEKGEKISTENVKSLIFELIDSENNSRPLKDSAIVNILKAQEIRIARRTVAKYREQLKIAPYHQRKAKK